jgi:putative methanogenesis marker protein 17
MEIKVEGGDDSANSSYATICQDTFRDLGVRGSIDYAYLYLSPAEHVFFITIKIGRIGSPVTVDDITLLEEGKFRISNEKYAPKLLAMLWDRYGERVQQLSRLELALDVDYEEMTALKAVIVYDPRDDLVIRLLDAIDRILPEGARVRYPIQSPNRITIIASENAISDEWKQKAEEIVRREGNDV